LGEPFTPTISHSDPKAERAREERLRKEVEAGLTTPREFARRTGNQDLAEDDERWEVTINGETVNYGDLPKWVAKRKLSALGATDPDQAPEGESETEQEDGA
jgi:hypothetical protein